MRSPLTHLADLPQWEGAQRVAIDCETRDDQLRKLGCGARRGAYITGVSFAIDYHGRGRPNSPAFYLPIRHDGGGNYHDPDQIFAYLRHQAQQFRGDLVTANGGYDYDMLAEERVVFQPKRCLDVLVAGALLLQPAVEWKTDKDTEEKFLGEKFLKMNLDAECARHGIPGKDEEILNAWAAERGLNPKSDMWRAPAWIVEPYAKQDVIAPLMLIRRQLRRLEEQDLGRVFDVESRLLPVLVNMRRRGVKVNLAKVDEIDELCQRKEAQAAREVSAISGIPFSSEDINKAAVIAKHLERDGIKVPLTEKTQKPSVKAAWLTKINTPIAEAIKTCRKWNKVRTTFCASIRNHETNGRIHCTFNQLKMATESGDDEKGAGFGRLSSSNPNLQQQPARDPEIGSLWRSIYDPDDGGQWASLDYGSQEPRMLLDYAAGAGFPSALAAAEMCRTDPEWDNHSMMAGFIHGEAYSQAAYIAGDKTAKGLRGSSKTIFLGRVYGMGEAKLCQSLGLPTVKGTPDWAGGRTVDLAGPEGRELIDKFNAGVPYVREISRKMTKKAEAVGYVKTKLGRRCRFPRNPQTGKCMFTHKATNRVVQGSSGDQAKLAMVLADEAGIPLQLQVHDEFCLTIHNRETAEQLAHIMSTALPNMRVPFPVDIELGPNWGDAK